MRRNINYRDFTICKAVALVGLMGLAAALGGVPAGKPTLATVEPAEAQVIPALVYKFWDDCEPEEVGVEL